MESGEGWPWMRGGYQTARGAEDRRSPSSRIREASNCSHEPGVRRQCLANKGLSSVSSLTFPPVSSRVFAHL